MKGASKGEGLGNKFLANIRNTHAIIHVLRCFDNGNITHVDGSIDPVRDKGIIDTELQLKDLETVENRLAKTQKQATSGGDKNARRAVELLLQYKAALEQGNSARTVELEKEDRKLVADLNLLTDKPVLYVCNVDEKSAVTGNAYTEAVKAAIAGEKAEMLVVAAATEADIAELESYEERQMFLEDLGLEESGVARLIKSAYKLLNLETFFTTGAEEYILESLEWCGIRIDEGVGAGGPHAPYRQSERREIYLKYALQLVEAGWAYYAFDTAEELDALRREAEGRGEAFAYNYTVREKLATSLALPAEEVRARIDRGDQWVIRFRMPENEVVEMDDLIRGHVEVNTSTLDDKVLYKSADALPTYHLANIVDDHLMEVSHVIRGEEWLPSLPLHYLLYKAFGWTATQPAFAHLPLLLKPTGGGKLSKRDGDKMGFPVFPLFWKSPTTGETAHGYREDGYFPEAFINMLALLGWNPGTEQEIFSMQELIDNFSLERVSKSGARFQPDKAKWFNAQYMHHKSDAELAALYQPILRGHGIEVADEVAGRAAGIMKERATFITDLWDLTSFFFVAPAEYEEKQTRKYWKGQNPEILRELRSVLAAIDDFSLENTERIVHGWIEQKGYGMGQVMNTLRLALVGAGKGPGMYDVTSFIGKEETLRRIDHILATLKPAE